MIIIEQNDIDDYLRFSQNQIANFISDQNPISILVRKVDNFSRKIWTASPTLAPVELFLFVNAYFLLLASLRTAASGHVAAVFPSIRAALESSCYAFLISRKRELSAVWTNRDRSHDDRKACRKPFSSAATDVAKILRIEGHESTSKMVTQMYEDSITFGAHPNPISVLKHIENRPDDGNDFWKFNLTCIYDKDSFEGKHAIFSCIEYGIVLAAIGIVVHKHHKNTPTLLAEFQDLHESKERLVKTLGWKIRAQGHSAAGPNQSSKSRYKKS